MSNNYTQFSFAFKVKGLKAKAWIDRLVTKLSKACGDDTDDEEILELFPEWEFYQDCGFRTEMDTVPGKKTVFNLYVFSEENGNVEQTANFVQAILMRFDPKGRVGFQWADTSDGMGINEFGGGACLVTATSTRFMSTSMWLDEVMAA